MLFQVILLVLLGAIAFFQYIQGLFSATISAILAIFAAVIAMSYHEVLASFLISRFPDTAAALSLVAVFAAVYLAFRIAFDKMIPGNVRFPVLMDKVGAGLMGVFVGLIGTGIIAIAAQTMPFGPDIGGYSRFKLAGDVEGHYMRGGQWQNVPMHDMVNIDLHDPSSAQVEPLWFHQEDLIIGLTNKLSSDGALSNGKPLASIHPDYLAEMFDQRLGIQEGAKHTMVSSDAKPIVKVSGVYTQPELMEVEGEMRRIRHPELSDAQPVTGFAPKLKPEQGQKLLIVRTNITTDKDIADGADLMFRFSTGSVRLMAVQPGGSSDYKDYNPVATLDARGIAVDHRIDDFLLAALDKPTRTIDFVFIVDDAAVKTVGKTQASLYDGTFLEIKRYAVVDLSNKRVVAGPPINPDPASIILKPEVEAAIAKLPPQSLEQADTEPNK